MSSANSSEAPLDILKGGGYSKGQESSCEQVVSNHLRMAVVDTDNPLGKLS